MELEVLLFRLFWRYSRYRIESIFHTGVHMWNKGDKIIIDNSNYEIDEVPIKINIGKYTYEKYYAEKSFYNLDVPFDKIDNNKIKIIISPLIINGQTTNHYGLNRIQYENYDDLLDYIKKDT